MDRRAGTLGVCYYPEQWPEERWAEDARAMATFGLSFVRVAEFAWSRLEPSPGAWDWGWLDRAIATLGGAGLGVVLGTPTATPPKWLVDAHPDILPHDAEGRARGFGGRRHYCYGSATYRREARRIVAAMAKRYGTNPRVAGWQTDNEHANHLTAQSWAPHQRANFQGWLRDRYGAVEALNRAWGTVFWSQEYRDFGEVELPGRQVGRANMAQVLDWRRFCSDLVVSFDAEQVEILRRLSPGRFVTHNAIGDMWDFDHFALGRKLDFMSVNNYPLLAIRRRVKVSEAEQVALARTGHPDSGAMQFDLSRAQGPVPGPTPFWIMEGMAGPADAGDYNPHPAPGMVRLWAWEAFAHGAETVSWFRWRQVPYAQEQWWHALHRPDGVPSAGGREARRVAEELAALGPLPPLARSRVAILLDYEAEWTIGVQPHGADFSYAVLARRFYTALRRLGLDVDVVRAGEDLSPYALVAVPTLPIVTEEAMAAFDSCPGHVVFGPRTGSKTRDYQIPDALPPGPLQSRFPLKVVAAESVSPGLPDRVAWGGGTYPAGGWRDHAESALAPTASFDDGAGAAFRAGAWHLLAFFPDEEFLIDFLGAAAREAGLSAGALPPGLRLRGRGDLRFAFNYGPGEGDAPAPDGAAFLLGGRRIPARDLAAWRAP